MSINHQLKRLQHDVNSNLTCLSSNHHQLYLPNDEAIRESIQNFTVRPFRPAPRQARRGGGGRSHDRQWHSNVNLPKRMINYDLAESFLDHSTNPLSSDLYKIKFKHSTKQWPNGRFENYKEKLNKLDGNIIEITCTRTFPIINKRKQIFSSLINEQNQETSSFLTLIDPTIQQEKKKQVEQQTNIYANLFGGGRIPKLSSIIQSKKVNSTVQSISSSSSTAISLLDENQLLSS